MRMTRTAAASMSAAFFAILFAPNLAAAIDISPDIANCAELQGANKQQLVDACSRHTGCELMLKAKNSCAAAQEFLDKLGKNLAGKNEITNETVFYAALPRLTQSKAMDSKIDATKKILAAGRNASEEGTRTYKDNAGEITFYYEGGLKGDERHGVGILIGRSGSARFGQFSSDTHVGQGWMYQNDGPMFVGDFVANAPRGNVAYQHKNGVALVGNFDGAKWTGVIDTTESSGNHYKQVHDYDGKYIASYPASVPDGALLLLVQKGPQNTPSQQPGSSNTQPSPSTPSITSKADQEKIAQSLSSRTESTYTSVCARNWEKIYDIFRDRELRNGGATYDLFMQDIHWHMAKLYEPCKDTDQESAAAYAEAMSNYNSAKAYCAGPHEKWECTQWGASGGKSYNQGSPFDNIEYTRVWKAEVGKAVSDPNYSAEYGPIKWTGKSGPADIACWKGLREITRQYDAEKKNIPENSIVVLSEATMWKIAKSTELISAKCPSSSQYLPEISRMGHVYAGIQRACDASSSSPPCVPRLPGKPSVSPPVAVANALPPLQRKPEQSGCTELGGANFKQCMATQCDKAKGKLYELKEGCYLCLVSMGTEWTTCPKGSKGVGSVK